MTDASFYYFFSTAAQSLAALLGITTMIYISLLDSLQVRCRDLANDFFRLWNRNPLSWFVGSTEDAINRANQCLGTINNSNDDRKDNCLYRVRELERTYTRLQCLRPLPRLALMNLVIVAAFILMTPFAKVFAEMPRLSILLGGSLIIVSCWETGKLIRLLMSSD